MNSSVRLLEKLSNANGISGFEDHVVDVIKSFEPDRFEYEEDTLRNVFITDKSAQADKGAIRIMLDAHSDEVGFIVQSIKDSGLIKFLPIGGWIPFNASAQKVKVLNRDGEEITGIISSKPPHFMSEEERKKPVDFDTLFIDVGASSKEEVMEVFKIDVGAPVTPDVAFEHVERNDTMIGKAFDNRIGCACVLEVMKAASDIGNNKEVVGAIASQEEIGTRGAVITARKIKPDIAIVFEGTPADDGFKPNDEAQSVLGKGPQIRHIDRSMITNPRFVKFARKVAQEHGIDFQDAVRKGGGTNGGPIHLAEAGIPTIVLGVPVRYVHTHYGISAVSDYEKCIQWALEIIQCIEKEDVTGF